VVFIERKSLIEKDRHQLDLQQEQRVGWQVQQLPQAQPVSALGEEWWACSQQTRESYHPPSTQYRLAANQE
jgi:hypothetical protein